MQKLKSHGGNVWQGGSPEQWLDYSANVRPEGPQPWVKQALASAMELVSYYPPQSLETEKACLGEFLGLAPSLVLPVSGGASAIVLAHRQPVRRVILLSPCFSEYETAARRQGLEVVKVSLFTAPHRLGEPAELLGPVLREGDLVWLCNPLNPVGVSFPRASVLALLRLAEERGARLAVDEAFTEFCPGASVRDLLPEHENLLITGSMTKCLGIPGVRLGYLCGAYAKELEPAMLPWELNCFALSVLRALPGHGPELEREAEVNAGRRIKMKKALEAMGLFVYPSASNFLLADFGRDTAGIVSALKERHILVRQCFDFAGIDDGTHLRFAVKTEERNEVFLNALREVL